MRGTGGLVLAAKFLILNRDDDPSYVKGVLAKMGFTHIKDLKSPIYDLSARHSVKGTVAVGKLAREIFNQTNNRVLTVHAES